MRRRQILIELTPLLDVILILLFCVLVRSGQGAAATRAALTEAEGENAALTQALAETEDALGAALRRERTLTAVEEESAILTISVEERGVRRILVESEYADRVYITLDAARYDTAAQRLESVLRSAIINSGRESVFLVFQYDRTGIYHREYALIAEVIQALKPELLAEEIYLSVVELDYLTKEE